MALEPQNGWPLSGDREGGRSTGGLCGSGDANLLMRLPSDSGMVTGFLHSNKPNVAICLAILSISSICPRVLVLNQETTNPFDGDT